MSAIKKMIKSASASHKRGMEMDGEESMNGNEEESFVVKLFEEVLPLLGRGKVLDMGSDPLALAVLTWSVEHDDLQLMRLLLKHSSMTPALLQLKHLTARLASREDGTQPALFLPEPVPTDDLASSKTLEKARDEERLQLQLQMQQQHLGGAVSTFAGDGRLSTSFYVLMWIGIAVQIAYISLVCVQSLEKLSTQLDTP